MIKLEVEPHAWLKKNDNNDDNIMQQKSSVLVLVTEKQYEHAQK